MRKIEDQRAVSTLVGAILIFALVIVSLSIYQAQSVPSQNSEIEIQHNDRVIGDLIDLRDAIVSVASTGGSDSVTVELGTQYPSRIVAINPPPVSGTLTTTGPYDIHVSGVNGEVCYGSDATYHLRYEPEYAEYEEYPITKYENTILYNDFDGEEIALTNQQAVFGNESDIVHIVSIESTFSERRVRPISIDVVEGNTLVHEGITDPTVELPTTVTDESTWAEILDDELGEDESFSLNEDQGIITLELKGDYTILCSTIGIGGPPTSGAVAPLPPSYDDGGPVPPGSAQFSDITASPDGPGSIDQVDDIGFTFTVEGDTDARDVSIEVVSDDSRTDTWTGGADTEGEIVLDWGSGGNNNRVTAPIDVTVQLLDTDGQSVIEECTATISDNTDEKTFEDFDCN